MENRRLLDWSWLLFHLKSKQIFPQNSTRHPPNKCLPLSVNSKKIGNEGGCDDDDDDEDDYDDDDNDDNDNDDNDDDTDDDDDLQSILTAGCLPPSSESNTDASSWLLSSCFHYDYHDYYLQHPGAPLEVEV